MSKWIKQFGPIVATLAMLAYIAGFAKLRIATEGVEAFRVTNRLSDSDRAKLMGGTLQHIYNWAKAEA